MSAVAARVSARLILVGLALVASSLATPLIINNELEIYYDPNTCITTIITGNSAGVGAGYDTLKLYAIGPMDIYDSNGTLLTSFSGSTIYVVEEYVDPNYNFIIIVHSLDGSNSQQVDAPENVTTTYRTYPNGSVVPVPDVTYEYQVNASCAALLGDPLYGLGYPIIVLSYDSSISASGAYDYETYSFNINLAGGNTQTLYLHLLVSSQTTTITYTSGVAAYTLTIEPPPATTTTTTSATTTEASAVTSTSSATTTTTTTTTREPPWILEPSVAGQLQKLEVSLDTGSPRLPPAASLGLGAAAAVLLLWLLSLRR